MAEISLQGVPNFLSTVDSVKRIKKLASKQTDVKINGGQKGAVEIIVSSMGLP
jgi:hypothetical protein